MPEYDAVLFDLDGTLADTMSELSVLGIGIFRRGFDLTPQAAAEAYRATAGAPFNVQLEEFAPGGQANCQLGDEFETAKVAIFEGAELYEDALGLLESLIADGTKLAVVSSTREELVHEFALRTGLAARVDCVLGHRGGDDKTIQILQALKWINGSPESAIFVGDAPRDADYAGRAGVDFLGIEHTFARATFLDRGLDSVPDLRAVGQRLVR